MTTQTLFDFARPSRPTSTFTDSDQLTVVDLCCGAGMASLGFKAAGGYDILGGVDIWDDAVEAFCLNHGNDYDFFQDAGWLGVEGAAAGRQEHSDGWTVDVVLTGPPCQDDSLANHAADKGRGAIKAPALAAARAMGATWIIMEMVTSKYADWCRSQGARQILKLQDCKLGGFTMRTRWFAVWGPWDLVITEEQGRGWGEALGVDDPDARLATESNSKAKRWQRAKAPHEAADACVGGDRRHVIRLGNGEEIRLGPQDEAALAGFPNLELQRSEHMCNGEREWTWTQGAQNERDANTMVGNGWPMSFGRAIGRAITRRSR